MSASQVRVPAAELVDGDTVWFDDEAVTFDTVTRGPDRAFGRELVVGVSIHGRTYKWLPEDQVLVEIDTDDDEEKP